jgi:hypothetical protein
MTSATSPVIAGPVLAPLWKRSRLWIGLGCLVLVVAMLAAAVKPAPGLPLDPSSPSKAGSKALAQLLAHRGTTVRRLTALADLSQPTTVVVAYPDSYSADQLASLVARGNRLVLIGPSNQAIGFVDSQLSTQSDDQTPVTANPDCDQAAASAAGTVSFTLGTQSYQGRPGCYGGRLILTPRLVILGSQDLIRNDGLSRTGVAAIAINAISDDGAVRNVSWVLPGSDAGGAGTPSIWSVFPNGSRLALGWLILVGLLTALWRGRRLGPPVTEPLPVIVRAAEIVEGHGRLYQRAQARERAAAALRSAAIHRLAARFGLPRDAGVIEVSRAVNTVSHRPDAATVLGGPMPADDAELVRLASDLAELGASKADRPVPTAHQQSEREPTT